MIKLGASAAASRFFKCGFRNDLMNTSLTKYQVKPHSSPWFSDACAAAIVHRNHFFHLYKKFKSSASKAKFRQASNCCKRTLEAAKLACTNKIKESITSQKLGSSDFWQIANNVLNKGKSGIPPQFNSSMVSSAPKGLSSHPIKC